MTKLDYRIEASTGASATLGLIVLKADETLEGELRRLIPMPEIAIHISRVPSGSDLTQETIAEMGEALPSSVALLPETPRYDAIAYACTSGATLLGRDRVTELVKRERDADVVLDPMGAVISDCAAKNISKLAVVTPYTADIGRPVSKALADAGITVVSEVHFGEASEANVARIAPESIADAARQVTRDGVEGVFLSCTNLRTLDLIGPLEAELGIPVLSSNLCLARALARAAGVIVVMPGPET